MKGLLWVNVVSVAVVCVAAACEDRGEQEKPGKKIHTTCATDLQCGLATYLNLDSQPMEWSTGPGKAGWLYCHLPHSKEKSARWEFAPSTATEIEKIDVTKLPGIEFHLEHTPALAAAFGDRWKKGSPLLATEGEIYFARRSDAPTVVYVLKMKQREKWRLWVDYAIADVPAKGDTKKSARWRIGTVKGEEDPQNILGTGLLLSPEEAREALVSILGRPKAFPETVVVRKGHVVFGGIVCDLQKGTFYSEIIGDDFLSERWGSFKQEGKAWKAVLEGERQMSSEDHYGGGKTSDTNDDPAPCHHVSPCRLALGR
jgi:hypothetical protein